MLILQRIITLDFDKFQLQILLYFFYTHQERSREQFHSFVNVCKILEALTEFCLKRCDHRHIFPLFSTKVGRWISRFDFGKHGEGHKMEVAQLCLKETECHTECFHVCVVLNLHHFISTISLPFPSCPPTSVPSTPIRMMPGMSFTTQHFIKSSQTSSSTPSSSPVSLLIINNLYNNFKQCHEGNTEKLKPKAGFCYVNLLGHNPLS